MARRTTSGIAVLLLLGLAGLLTLSMLVGFGTLLGFVAAVVFPGALAARFVLGRSAPVMSLMLTLLLGLSFLVLAGLLLSASPFALTGSALLVLLVVGLSFALLAAIRAKPWMAVTMSPPSIKPSVSLAALLVAILLAGGAIVGARMAAAPQSAAPLWQLWIQKGGVAGHDVEIGLRNAAGPAGSGTLILDADGAPLQRWADIHLEPGTEWRLTLPSDEIPAGAHELDLSFSSGDGSAIRHTTLSLPDQE